MSSSASELARLDCHALLLYGDLRAPIHGIAREVALLWLNQTVAEGEPDPVDLQIFHPFGNPPIHGLETIQPSDTARAKQFEGIPIRQYLRTRPLSAQAKVVVLHEAERMNGHAANALLKTLEEPPPYARIILTTRSLGRILPTIKSRCVCVPVASETASPDWPPAWGHEGLTDLERELLDQLLTMLNAIAAARPDAHLRSAHDLRQWAKEWQNQTGRSDREAIADMFRFAAGWLANFAPHGYNTAYALAEAHRLVVGNVHETMLVTLVAHHLTGVGSKLALVGTTNDKDRVALSAK